MPKTIVFRPGVVSYDDHVATWAEVETAIAAEAGRLRVIVDDSVAPAIVPSTADTDCLGGVDLTCYGINSNARITIADGGRLKNLAALHELIVIAAPTVRAPFYYDRPLSVVDIVDTTLASDTGATKALFEIDVATFVAYMTGESFLDNTAAPTVPLVHVNAGNFFGLTVVGANFATLSPNAIEGDNTTSFTFEHDASIVMATQALMAGSVTEYRLTNASAMQPAAGPTSARPTLTDPSWIGQTYFDTTLGFRVDWDGTNWVDASGGIV